MQQLYGMKSRPSSACEQDWNASNETQVKTEWEESADAVRTYCIWQSKALCVIVLSVCKCMCGS